MFIKKIQRSVPKNMIDDIQFNNKDKIFILLVICGLILAFYLHIFDSSDSGIKKSDWSAFSEIEREIEMTDGTLLEMKLGEGVLQAEIVLSDEKKKAGLGNKNLLPDNQGMLFVFSQKGKYAFEMRNMKFDLDFILIDGDEIVEIIKNIPSDFEGNVIGENYYDKVLEVNAGWSDQNRIMVGEKLEWKVK